jgi:hypothetical protein
MPDLDLIKQGEQGCGTGAGGLPRQSRRPVVRLPRPSTALVSARRRGRGADAQSRQTGARRRPGGVAVMPAPSRSPQITSACTSYYILTTLGTTG